MDSLSPTRTKQYLVPVTAGTDDRGESQAENKFATEKERVKRTAAK